MRYVLFQLHPTLLLQPFGTRNRMQRECSNRIRSGPFYDVCPLLDALLSLLYIDVHHIVKVRNWTRLIAGEPTTVAEALFGNTENDRRRIGDNLTKFSFDDT